SSIARDRRFLTKQRSRKEIMAPTDNFELAEAFRLEQKKETKAKACPVASGMFQSASTLISSSDDEATD
ncbi:unnamed protein product, partial [Oikopleura dioica]